MELLTITEVAKRLKVSTRTVHRTIANGELMPIRLSESLVRLTDAEVSRWIQSRPVGRSEQPKQLRKAKQ